MANMDMGISFNTAEAQRIREARNSSQTTTAQGEGEKTEEKTE